MIDRAEHLLDDADPLAGFVLGRGLLDNMPADPAGDGGHDPGLEWPLDIAKQDDAGLVGRVFGVMDEGLVEHQVLAIAPRIFMAVDEDAADPRVGRRHQTEMVAQRAGVGITVGLQPRAGGERREHRALDGGDRLQQVNRTRAGPLRRRQRVVVPFEVEPLPAAAEERVEAPVVVTFGCLDAALIEQRNRFVADHLPVVAQPIEFGEQARRDQGLIRHLREQVHQHVVGREDARMVAELAAETEAHAPAKMHGQNRCCEGVKSDKLRRQKAFDHDPQPTPIRPAVL